MWQDANLSLYRMMGRFCLSVSASSSRRPPWAQSVTSSHLMLCGLYSDRHCSVFRSCWLAFATDPLAVRNLHKQQSHAHAPC